MRALMFALLVALPAVGRLEAATLFVSKAGNDANDGLFWATAKQTIQAGVDAAVSGDQVWVAAGTYVQRIVLKQGVALYGGFAGGETGLSQRNWIANTTVLDGDQGGSVVTVPTGATGTTVIDGFTICNGKASSGGGIYLGSPSSPTIAHNTITGNRASAYGGGLYLADSSPTIASNTITGNSARSGGGLYLYSSSPTITNTTVAGNNALSGGGLFLDSSSPTITNTIVASNSSGIYRSGGTPALGYNCVYGNGAYDYSGVTDPTGTSGNIKVDPKLANPAYRNYHLQSGSPCIDAGNDKDTQKGWLDIDGQPRKQGLHVDIGADESDGTTWPSGPNRIVRVSTGGSDANDGSSWTLTKRTVQAGIDAAAGAGGETWVVAGTYYERIMLHPYAYVYGGFSGTETRREQRDWRSHATILDGQQAGSVVTAAAGYQASAIDGFTIRNGQAFYGGGLFLEYSSPMIAHNTITGNSASYGGGGLYLESFSVPTIVNNTITGNSASYGGGLHLYSCSPTIADNTITGNGASFGGGLYLESSSSPTIVNNTIAGNGASSDGGGLYLYYASPTIADTVIAFNSSGICQIAQDGGTSMLQSNCVYGNAAYNYSGLTDPTGTYGNIGGDPLFVVTPSPGDDGIWATADDDPGDTHLTEASPCVNTGDPAYTPAPGETDVDDQPRLIGPRIDIGADEFTYAGDVNGDGRVDVEDLLWLVEAFGSVPGDPNYNPDCDFNHDDSVDVVDLLTLVENFGKSL